ncbi:MAG TPA: AAA family ATPase, partial [Candidatus Nanopelagicales bacterium]|nr:AAA family ATPase [Candidatus Nanopelagicales bacterium]
MKIPYGRSNFAEIRRRGFFYVDKTPFLPVLERDESGYGYLIFLRPRRMGKSLFLSLLEHYYDIARAKEFDELFSGLWVHENPTPERGSYLVLTFDFSQVSVDGGLDSIREGFFEAAKGSVRTFLSRYRERIQGLGMLQERLEEYKNATSMLIDLQSVISLTRDKLYVLIDEYDNFVNRLLSAGVQDMYETIVQRTGFVRTFYATLKAGTASGAVGRIFITGVSPLLLDDLSSGFNIATNASQDRDLNALAGFTRADVEQALNEFFAARPELSGQPEFADRGRLLEVLEANYDGYRFSPEARERVFNSDMVLYFLGEIARKRGYPTDLLDLNVRTDYSALQRIGALTGTARAARRTHLEAILADGGIQS